LHKFAKCAGILRELPRIAADVMTHGELVRSNALVCNGRLTGVIDVGGLGPADPALDLLAAWHLLETGPRQTLREDLDCDQLEWERGKAWAVQQAMRAVWYYLETNPRDEPDGPTRAAMHHRGHLVVVTHLRDPITLGAPRTAALPGNR
jgi:aminoglycoside phosphotransferase (APT) family kinase protein